MSSIGKPDRDELLGRLWDALQESGALGSDDVDAEDVEVITRLHGAEDVPSPNDETIQRMWIAVDAGLVASNHAAPARSLEFHTAPATAVAADYAAQPARQTRSWASLERHTLQRVTRTIAAAVVTGFVLGFLVLGGGGRVAMRLAAMMSADELQGATTENLETVGEMTLSGTLSLMMTGGFFGIGLALGYVLIASLLPQSGWRRLAASGAVFFAVCGFTTLEGGQNRDYERFGIAGVNVCLFTVLPLIYGLLIPLVFEKVDQRISHNSLTGRSMKSAVVSTLAAASLLPAFFGLMMLLILPPLQLFVAAPLLALAGRWAGERWGATQERWAPWVRRIALAGPSVAGLVLTLIAVGRIM